MDHAGDGSRRRNIESARRVRSRALVGVRRVDDGTSVLALQHGRTCTFTESGALILYTLSRVADDGLDTRI